MAPEAFNTGSRAEFSYVRASTPQTNTNSSRGGRVCVRVRACGLPGIGAPSSRSRGQCGAFKQCPDNALASATPASCVDLSGLFTSRSAVFPRPGQLRTPRRPSGGTTTSLSDASAHPPALTQRVTHGVRLERVTSASSAARRECRRESLRKIY